MVKNILNIHKVSNKVKKALISAENIFRDYQFKDTLPDASMIVVGYSKALELMLDEKISEFLKPFLYKKYGNERIRNQDIWKKFGSLRLNKSITLGTWMRIIDDFSNPNISDELIYFKDLILSKFNIEELEKIKKASNLIINPRNIGAHKEIITMDKVTDLRDEIIKIFNEVIDFLYD
jgi:hypothetical protein